MITHPLLHRTRRHFFQDCGIGVGKIALASLLANETFGAIGKPDFMRFPVKAKRVIYLFMAGAPSQLELFDDKPKLKEIEGKPIPPSVIKGQRYAFIQPDAAVLGPRFPFAKHGQSGAEFSDRLPYLSKVADDLTIIKSMHTDHFNHAPAQLFMTTGSGIPGRASMGSWLSYGIGSEANDLPGFVVMRSGGNLSGGSAMWGSGFLPSEHQGVPFREGAEPILHVANPKGIDRTAQRQTLDLLNKLNRGSHGKMGDPEINARIEAYEMAYRMQARAPELMDFSKESQETLDLYGVKKGNLISPAIAYLPGDWPSGAPVLSSSITADGMPTAMWQGMSQNRQKQWIRPVRLSFRILKDWACWKIPWLYGVENLDVPPWLKPVPP